MEGPVTWNSANSYYEWLVAASNLVASLLLVPMPGAPSSLLFLAVTPASLLLVAMAFMELSLDLLNLSLEQEATSS